ncbi:hypothetical protein FJZ26_02545 [Candidatus Parvarchaeota archaeon]|nr:hypothetical protein [Candidatus Parvarchaeota archaeon]
MVLRTLEGPDAIAETVLKCRPSVISGIRQEPLLGTLSRLEKNCSMYSVPAEMITYLKAAAMKGARCIGLMNGSDLASCNAELASIATNHIPVVLLVANRSSFFPAPVLCDYQGAYQVENTGWVMLFCSTLQELADTLPQAFKTSSFTSVPVMVFIDGFYHTHQTTQINIAPQDVYDKFLADIKIRPVLDFSSKNVNMESATPKEYEKRLTIYEGALQSVKERIIQAEYQWNDLVGREYGNGLYSTYMIEDAQSVLVCMGSFYGNALEAAERQRKLGIRSGLVRLKCFRPFPYEVAEILENKKVGVMERALKLGSRGSVYLDLLEVAQGGKNLNVVAQFVCGIGGSDLNVKHARIMLEKIEKGLRTREQIEGN